MTISRSRNRRGTTLTEVVIIIAILAVLALFILMAVPRSRENARLKTCEDNLRKLGVVMGYYDSMNGHLPMIPAAGERGPGPLAEMLGHFGLGDLEKIGTDDTSWAVRKQLPTSDHFVREFVCPSDPRAMRGGFPAPVNYRANTGSRTNGVGGPFAFGATTKIAESEDSAGSDFTAGFAERLVGTRTAEHDPLSDYRKVPGPVDEAPCPTGPTSDLEGDAGSSWSISNWTSTLYSHAMPPNAMPSCIAQDGRTARMGASSAHAGRVNVLMLGGSVRGFSPTIDLGVWQKFAGVAAKDRAPVKIP